LGTADPVVQGVRLHALYDAARIVAKAYEQVFSEDEDDSDEDLFAGGAAPRTSSASGLTVPPASSPALSAMSPELFRRASQIPQSTFQSGKLGDGKSPPTPRP
jgi:hypothetical protein